MTRRRSLPIAAIVLFALTGSVVLADPTDDFRAGIAQFRAQQYDTALVQFESAYDAGMRTPTLFYNLGVTHFQLANYAQAYAAFQRIGDDAEWGALAQYNMGLIEERRGRSSVARVHYIEARNRADAPQVRALAEAKLRIFAEPDDASPVGEASWTGLVSVGSGYEDNVLLTGDDIGLNGAVDDGDIFGELFGVGSRYLSGNRSKGWRLDVAGYYRGYADFGAFNVGLAALGGAHTRRIGAWWVDAGVRTDLQFAGSDHFATRGTVPLRATRTFGPVTLHLRNELSYIDGASGFAHLTGLQNVTGAEFSGHWRIARLRLAYELEYNDREDFVDEESFASYSPSHHRLSAGTTLALTRRLGLDARVEHRWSRYQDANIRVDTEGDTFDETRDAERLRLRTRLTFAPASEWLVFAEYQYTDNASDVARYSYESSQLMLGLDWKF